jgi:DNA-binding MarR family transcriptional regulator
MGDDTLTVQEVKHNGHEELTLLELVLQLHGDFRRSLEPIRVTTLQAGVILFLRRHTDAKLTDAAASLGVRLPTLSEVVKDLVRKRWVTKRRSATDTRAVCLSLSRRGEALAQRIKDHVREVRSDLTPMKEA